MPTPREIATTYPLEHAGAPFPPISGGEAGLTSTWLPSCGLSAAGRLRDRRLEPRWRDRRLALVRFAGGETPAITADISLNGVRLGLPNPVLGLGEAAALEIALTQNILQTHSRVVHVRRTTWGCLVGICFTGATENLSAYLARRYSR